MKKKETKSKFDDAKNWLFMLKFIFSVNPSFLILSFAANTLIELSWSLPQVVLLKYVIDIVSEGARLYRVAAALACYACFLLPQLGHSHSLSSLIRISPSKPHS